MRSVSVLAQRDVVQRDVDAGEDLARRELDDRRHADARPRARPAPIGPRSPRASCSTQRLLRGLLGRRRSCDSRELAALEHGDGDLRPADVDADELIAHPSSLAAAGSQQRRAARPRSAARARRASRVRRVAERALHRLRLVVAGDQEDDPPRAVQRRQRQRDARHLRLHPGQLDADHQPPALLDLRLAREQRGAVRVRPEPEQQQVPARRRRRGARAPAPRSWPRRLRPELALHPHARAAATPSAAGRAARRRPCGSSSSPLSGGTQRSSLNQIVAPLQSTSARGAVS